MPVSQLTRDDLERSTIRVVRPASQARPDVRLVSANGRRLVVKDYALGARPFKRLLGTYLVWRERAALERAAGIQGIPPVVGALGPCTLVTEYVETTEATSTPEELLSPEFFERLYVLVRELHQRGVVHGDLKKLENILITPDGKPVIVDFATAFLTGSSPLAAATFSWIADDDLRAIGKLKTRCAPHLLTEDERCFLQERSGSEKLFRWSRRYVRYIVKMWASPEHERTSIRLR